MAAHEDAGLTAVARVRKVRETDSRIGLTTALTEQRAAQNRVDLMRRRLESADRFATGSAAEFLALRESLAVLGTVLITVEEERNQASTISSAALTRWHHDRARLDAIQLLLDCRAADRRSEAGRREARELDDLATQRWLRQSTEAAR